MRQSEEGLRNALVLRSSLEEVDATIRALDAQLAITQHEKEASNTTNTSNTTPASTKLSLVATPPSAAALLVDKEKEYNKLSNKLELLAVRREEALEKKSKLELAMDEGTSNSITLQQINDELYALEAEIELKDIEIRRWKRKEMLSQTDNDFNRSSSSGGGGGGASLSASGRPQHMSHLHIHQNPSIVSEQVHKHVMLELDGILSAKKNSKRRTSTIITNKSKTSSKHDENRHEEEDTALKQFLYVACMECLKYRLRLKDTDLMFEDLNSQRAQLEKEVSMLNLSLKTEKVWHILLRMLFCYLLYPPPPHTHHPMPT
jgi:hypothetical protein